MPIAELGQLASITMGQSPDGACVNGNEKGLPFLQGSAEFGARSPMARVHCNPPLRVARAGAALLSVRAPVGTTNRADQDYCIGRGLAAVLAKQGVADDTFLLHAIEQNIAYLHRRSQGSTFLAIGASDLSSMPIAAPPFALQQRIAEVLCTIDDAIAHTEALIAKTRAIKAGLMHDLFTRGITPDGNLRPPREEAPQLYKQSPLGWIPKEWASATFEELLASRVILDIQDGNHGELHPKREDFVAEGIPFLMAADLSGGAIDFDRCARITRRQYDGLRIGFATGGDVLLSHKGTIGETALVPFEVHDVMLTPQVTYYRVRQGSRLLPAFLFYWMRNSLFQSRMKNLAAQSTRDYVGISAQKKLLRIVLPDPFEQDVICALAASCHTKLDTEVRYIAKLHETKRGLMQDLLTGRVRVPLPIETREPVPA